MELMTEDRAVLAHMVVDPDAHITHALTAMGQEAGEAAVRAKIERHRESYLAEKRRLGAAYKTRSQRDAEEEGRRTALRTAAAQAAAVEEATRFREAVAEAVKQELAKL
jgi:hypothetical protein